MVQRVPTVYGMIPHPCTETEPLPEFSGYVVLDRDFSMSNQRTLSVCIFQNYPDIYVSNKIHPKYYTLA